MADPVNNGSQGNNGGHVHRSQARVFAVRRRINRQAPLGGGETYMECRRNISLSTGTYTVDGCRGFLKVGAGHGRDAHEDALLCDACGCHRNFHRKVVTPQIIRVVEPRANFVMFNANRPFIRARMGRPPLPPAPVPMPAPVAEEPNVEIVESESEDSGDDKSEIDNESEYEEEAAAARARANGIGTAGGATARANNGN